MTTLRHTFVLHVHEDGGAVLLDEATREYVWMRDLSELVAQIAGRLEQAGPDPRVEGREPCSDSPSS